MSFSSILQTAYSIPFNIFQTWHSKDLSPKMLEAVNAVKEHNPEFSYHLYDDADCLDFITTYFDKSVVDAYNTLLPGAYKADLWRYCVLYIRGGVYLDIKYYPVNGFKFLELVKSEHFVKDREHFLGEKGIYNGFIISKPNNQILWNCIRQIVDNVNTQFYGKNSFEPTGPLLVSKFISEHVYNNLSLLYEEDSFNTVILLQHKLQKNVILRMYTEFREEQFKCSSSTNYYQIMWINKNIYKKSLNNISYHLIDNNNAQIINEIKPKMTVIPLNIFQTWHTKDLPPIILEAANSINITNPEFTYHLYDDADCLDFITTYFDKSVVDAYNTLLPAAYKADLWRYCVLYIHGGIYLDIKYYPVNGFKFLKLTDQEYFAKDIEPSGGGIYNAILITKPNNTILLNCIHKIVENVKNKFYGSHCLEPTGPLLLKQCCPPEVMNNNLLKLSDNGFQLLFNDNAILEFNREKYYSIKNMIPKSYNNYSMAWNNREMYNNSIFTETKVNSQVKSQVIPLNIFQTWYTKDLPPIILEAANSININNPEFTYHLYDEVDCCNFITTHFDKSVVDAYNSLVPHSYKADLWRYCVLYIHGGIYLDIKFYPVNGFKFLELTDKEYFAKDAYFSWGGVLNGLIITKPNNTILLNCIHKIVENVKNKFYGSHCLEPTGPLLLKQCCPSEVMNDNSLRLSNIGYQILFNDKAILEFNREKYKSIKNAIPTSYNNYSMAWNNKEIYNNLIFTETKVKTPVIPLNIFQTWHTKDLPPIILEAVNSININNPEFTYHLYDEVDCCNFITTHFDKSVVDAYNSLVPHSYKADLWRYCVLYIHGGIYLDIKFYPVNGFKFLELTDKEYFAKDAYFSWGGVLNGLIITKPNNTILLNCIHKIVENVKNKFYGSHCLEPTGPLLLKQCFPPEVTNNNHNPLRLSDNGVQILFNDKAILEFNREKYHSIKFSSQNYYNNYITLWNIKQVYNNSNTTHLFQLPIIPFNIFQTWHTKELPSKLLVDAVNSVIINNPAFVYHLYDDNDCLEFIKNNFNNEVFEAYINLITPSNRCDLWKYCILYIHGGIYLDILFYNITKFNFGELTNREYFVNDLQERGGGIYNGFMVVKPKNQILLNCILKIVENVKSKCYYSNPSELTGSLLLKQCLNHEQVSNNIMLQKLENNTIAINYNNKIILQTL